jgi:hypothetical protein
VASSLQLVEGARGSADDGGPVRRSRRDYLDFVVDGESLGDQLAPVLGCASLPADYVPVLVLDWPMGFPAEDYGRLVGELPAPLPDGRVPLYICAECGDLGCGGITAVIERSADTVVWRDFGYQNDYEPFDVGDVLPSVGPIVFDRPGYLDALAAFKDRWPDAGVK